MAITKNIVTDYGADNTGTTDAAPKFYTNLKTDMAGQDVVDLTIPAGSYKFASSGGQTWAGGMTTLNVTATGATLFDAPGGGVELGSRHLAQIGIDEAGGKSARVQSVLAGATSVTLTAASASAGHISRAVIGRWMLVAGYDIQGLFLSAYGFPSNFHFIDFVQITDIDGNTISFTPPLQNTYLDTWPEMNRGSAFEQDSGGPASVFFLDPAWYHASTFTGGTYTNSNLIKGEGHTFIMNGGTSTSLPIFPTVNKLWRAINHTATAALVEHDKLCDWVDVQGGTYVQWHEQSSSTNLLSLSGVTITGSLNGTPRNATVDNCSIGTSTNIGPTGYGRGDTFIARNSTFGGVIGGGQSNSGPGASGFNIANVTAMSNGIISIPKCFGDISTRCFPPDPHGRNVLFWTGTIGSIGSFRVLGVTSDPWPATDGQSATTNVTIANGSKNLAVSSNIFQASDIGKVIVIPTAAASGTRLKTVITAYTSATQVTLFDACSNASGLSASSQTLDWGTCNVYIQTNQSGGFPSSSLYSSLGIFTPPARTVYFDNCSGTAQALDLSQAGAWNKPLWSYSKRTYDGSAQGPNILMHGNVTSIKFNVITPYTGGGALSVGLSQFDNLPVIINGTASTLIPRVNLKIAGERVLTVGSTTGAQSGDTNLTLSANTWIGRTFNAAMSSTVTAGQCEFTIEMITDQGFFTGPIAVAPLRLRLRAA